MWMTFANGQVILLVALLLMVVVLVLFKMEDSQFVKSLKYAIIYFHENSRHKNVKVMRKRQISYYSVMIKNVEVKWFHLIMIWT